MSSAEDLVHDGPKHADVVHGQADGHAEQKRAEGNSDQRRELALFENEAG